jgi:hypothetical protein
MWRGDKSKLADDASQTDYGCTLNQIGSFWGDKGAATGTAAVPV